MTAPAVLPPGTVKIPPADDLEVRRLGPAHVPSPLDGPFLPDERSVVVATDPEEITRQVSAGCLTTLRRAGPRARLAFDPAESTLGIVTCGGLCPGLNDVIRAVTRTALRRYGMKKVLGFRFGYSGLVARSGHPPTPLTLPDVALIHRQGGSVLGVSRGHQDPAEMVAGLVEHGVDTLVAIGGDGTLRGVHALCDEIARRGRRIAVVGVPKTIDNDVGWVQRSFGLDTAVAVASEALVVASTEARSAWGASAWSGSWAATPASSPCSRRSRAAWSTSA